MTSENRLEIAPGEPAGERGTRAARATSEPEKATAGPPARPGEAFEVDPELAEAERRFAETQGEHPMLPEEQATLDESKAAVEKASLIEQAYQSAAACLKNAGI